MALPHDVIRASSQQKATQGTIGRPLERSNGCFWLESSHDGVE